MLWVDFMNSYWRNWRTSDRSTDQDRLEDPKWLAEWLAEHKLPAAAPPRLAELEQLKGLRGLLWDELQRLVAGGVSGDSAACAVE
ncbi:ABATE domain-containing protein [Paenibacillus rhizoplanae]